MKLSELRYYSEMAIDMAIERVAQRIEVFNDASSGTIILSADGFAGDYLMKTQFKSIKNAFRRVDRKIDNATVAPTPLAQKADVGVKVAGGATVLWEPAMITWLQANPTQAVAAIVQGTADGMLEDQLNTGLLAGVAAIGNSADAKFDGKAKGIEQAGLNKSHALFGDRSGSLLAQVMTGAAYHALINEAIANGTRLFSSDNVTIIDILGKRVIVTDAPALTVPGTTPKNLGNTLTLTAGGIIIDNVSDVISNIETSNGKARIETTYQVDYTFGVNVKGYEWDETAGGKSPNDAALGTGANWKRSATSVKDTAGVLATFDADK